MKKVFFHLLVWLTFFQVAQAQTTNLPLCPSKLEFTDVLVSFTPEAKTIINQEVQRLLIPENRYLFQKVERMQLYFPIIERILTEQNAPLDLKYLAVHESGLLSDVVSTSNAIGYWQLKSGTAHDLGLVIDNNVDERKHLQKSTAAAVVFLKKSNIIYRNWISSILSYYMGVTGASPHVPVDWSFAKEITMDGNTNVYLLKLMAHKIAFEKMLQKATPLTQKILEIPVRGGDNPSLALKYNMSGEKFTELNSWVLNKRLPDNQDYVINVLGSKSATTTSSTDPRSTTSYFIDDTDTHNSLYPKLKRVSQFVTSPDQPVFYEINDKEGVLAQTGNEAYQLAKNSKVNIRKFLRYNDLSPNHLIKPNQVYYLESKRKRGPIELHTLAKNESLWDVSQKYGVKLKKLYKYNRIKLNEQLVLGRVIWLQRKRPANRDIEYRKIQEEEPLPPVPVVDISTHDSENEDYADKTITTTVTDDDETEDDGLKENDPLFGGNPSFPDQPELNNKPKPKPNTNTNDGNSSSANYTHRVLNGETLYSISKNYGLTVIELKKLNHLSPNENIKTGQYLVVRKGSNPVSVVHTEDENLNNHENNNNSSSNHHVVVKGETVYSISRKYRMTVSQLQKMNDLSNYSIEIGQRLNVSQKSANGGLYSNNSATNSNSGKRHTVKPGDTLYSIAKKYGVSIEHIRRINHLPNNSIPVGSQLKVQ